MIRWLVNGALALALVLGGISPLAVAAPSDDAGTALVKGGGKGGKHKGKHKHGKHKGKHKGRKKHMVEAAA